VGLLHTPRDLPRVDALLGLPAVADLPRAVARQAARDALDAARATLSSGQPVDREGLDADVARRAAALARPSLRPVINATGVVLHTNLGRAPWPEAAVAAAAAVARGWCNLELQLDDGERGGRGAAVEALLCALTGAEAALVVNNGAAAVLLAVSALGGGGEVVVSRGELVEIGGSFRIPDIVALSGARLVEVGTTNRTTTADYAGAVTERTAALLVVHPSNYRQVGFVGRPVFAELAAVAAASGLALIRDVGSGALTDEGDEPSLTASVSDGATVVTCSGDKLLGGPQAGLIVGTAAAVRELRRHPLYRALRVDKVTLAGLEATLWAWRWGGPVPVRDLRAADPGVLRARAERVAEALAAAGATAVVVAVDGTTGGGSLPGDVLPGWGVDVAVRAADGAAAALRRGDPPVVCRVVGGALRVDLRTVAEDDEAALIRRLADVAAAR
jgi:L-seryl-tRNA(Ser) seleniumtransferase